MYYLSIMSKLEEWSEAIKAWIFENYSNPLLWVGIVIGGVVIFKTLFTVLNKD